MPRLLPGYDRLAVPRTPDAESLHQLHLSVLQGDSAAATSLTARLMLSVRGLLGQRLRRVDSAIIDEGIEDAILDYLSRPATYQGEKANLLTFIAMAAARNVFDALRRDSRRRAIESRAATELARPWTSLTDAETKSSDAFDLFAGAQTEGERRFLEAKLAGETCRRSCTALESIAASTRRTETNRQTNDGAAEDAVGQIGIEN